MAARVLAGLLLAILAASTASAYDEAHLKRLLSEKRCPGCDLSGAQIVDEDMRKAYLPGADLSGANLIITNFNDANLAGANLSGADLSGGVLNRTILDGADLTGAKVEDADFTGAHLSGADVTGVDWSQATGANLAQAKGAPAGYVEPAPAPEPKPIPQVAGKLTPLPKQMKSQRLGTTMLMATPFCPAGTYEATGAKLQINDHPALFSLYGTIYGGDGRTNFALPDMQSAAPAAGLRYCIVADGAFPERN